MVEIKVCFGTKQQWIGEIDIDEYDDAPDETEVTDEDMSEAYQMLRDVLTSGDCFASNGRRNDQAVNACIALHVMGYDPYPWFANLFDDPYIHKLFYESDIRKFMEHVERIAPYMYKWGPVGNEGNALKYAL